MPTETRIALLEQNAAHTDLRLSDLEEFQSSILERLDRHLEQNSQHQLLLVQTLAKASTSIDSLSDVVKDIARSASAAEEKASLAILSVSKLETVGITLMKVASIGGILVSAAWALFLFFSNRI